MMYIHMTFSKKKPLHSTELFKIFFSLLTLSTAFLQKASGPGNKTESVVVITDRHFLYRTLTFCTGTCYASKEKGRTVPTFSRSGIFWDIKYPLILIMLGWGDILLAINSAPKFSNLRNISLY